MIQPSKDFNAKADFAANLFSDAQVVNGVITFNNSNILMNTETNTPLLGTYFFFRTSENVTNPKLSVNGSAPANLVIQHVGNPPESDDGPRENLDLVIAYNLYEVAYLNGLWRVLNVPAKISGSDIKPNTITSQNIDWAAAKGWIYSYSETSNVNSDTCTMNILLPPNKGTSIIGSTRVLGNGYSIIYDEFYIDTSASTTIHNIYTDAVGRKLEKLRLIVLTTQNIF